FDRSPDPDALLARFPDLAQALREHLAIDAALSGEVPVSATASYKPVATRQAAAKVAPPPGYEFVRELGRGGFGTVWLARHLALEKLVAVKHLRTEAVAGRTDQLA